MAKMINLFSLYFSFSKMIIKQELWNLLLLKKMDTLYLLSFKIALDSVSGNEQYVMDQMLAVK